MHCKIQKYECRHLCVQKKSGIFQMEWEGSWAAEIKLLLFTGGHDLSFPMWRNNEPNCIHRGSSQCDRCSCMVNGICFKNLSLSLSLLLSIPLRCLNFSVLITQGSRATLAVRKTVLALPRKWRHNLGPSSMSSSTMLRLLFFTPWSMHPQRIGITAPLSTSKATLFSQSTFFPQWRWLSPVWGVDLLFSVVSSSSSFSALSSSCSASSPSSISASTSSLFFLVPHLPFFYFSYMLVSLFFFLINLFVPMYISLSSCHACVVVHAPFLSFPLLIQKANGASIIFQGSISSYLAQPNCATYATMKGAIVQMVRGEDHINHRGFDL